MKAEAQEKFIEESAGVAEARRIERELQFEEELRAAEQRGLELLRQADTRSNPAVR